MGVAGEEEGVAGEERGADHAEEEEEEDEDDGGIGDTEAFVELLVSVGVREDVAPDMTARFDDLPHHRVAHLSQLLLVFS